jgi:hypothetical protein
VGIELGEGLVCLGRGQRLAGRRGGGRAGVEPGGTPTVEEEAGQGLNQAARGCVQEAGGVGLQVRCVVEEHGRRAVEG